MNIAAPCVFDVNVDGAQSNANRWKTWLRRFQNYVIASDIKTDIRKIALLLHVAGADVEEIYEAKRDVSVDKTQEKFDAIITLLNAHFEPQKNTELSTIHFRQLQQREGEGIDAFLVRLKSQAA